MLDCGHSEMSTTGKEENQIKYKNSEALQASSRLSDVWVSFTLKGMDTRVDSLIFF